MFPLSTGSIDIINAGQSVDEPVLKVLGYKSVPGGNGGQTRYRLLLTDGVKNHSFAMLATQLNHLIQDEKLVTNTVIRIKQYVCNNVQNNKKVLILLDVEILGVDTPEQVSEPKPDENMSDNVNKSVTSTPPKAANGPFPVVRPSPGTPNSNLPKVFPIQSLNPYQNRWTVRARVSQKASIRTWNKQGREGKLFSFTIVDESGEIKVTAFNAEVDKFFDTIEVNKAYYLSRANLKAANKQFNTTANDYEMTLNADSVLIPCEEEDLSSLPQTHFNFIPIGKLDTYPAGSFIDIVGIVHETGDVQTIMTKASQRELQKRELGIVDTTNCLVRLTLWGDEAVNFDGNQHPSIVVKGAKVSDFNGRSLSVGSMSSVLLAPENVAEAVRMKGWYEHDGRLANFETYRSEMMGGAGMDASGAGSGIPGCLGGWNVLADVKAPGVGAGAKSDFFTLKATVVFMKKENFMYQACSSDGCNKKVVDLGNGMYRCEKCARETTGCKWRLLLNAKIADISGEYWVTCFQDAAEALLGETADKMGAMREAQDESSLERVFLDAAFNSWLFRLRAKLDRYNDEERLRIVVIDVKPVEILDYSKRLVKAITDLAPSIPEEI